MEAYDIAFLMKQCFECIIWLCANKNQEPKSRIEASVSNVLSNMVLLYEIETGDSFGT